jgi:hypothetical protein
LLDNLIVCVLSDGFTAIERTMMQGGEPERVLEMRRDFQRVFTEPWDVGRSKPALSTSSTGAAETSRVNGDVVVGTSSP